MQQCAMECGYCVYVCVCVCVCVWCVYVHINEFNQFCEVQEEDEEEELLSYIKAELFPKLLTGQRTHTGPAIICWDICLGHTSPR